MLVRVQWAWLALPFFVVLASGLFLIIEMVGSPRTTDIRLWKSTAMSLLFHSVSLAEGIMRTGIQGSEQLHRVAKQSRLRLERPKQSDEGLLNRVMPYSRATVSNQGHPTVRTRSP